MTILSIDPGNSTGFAFVNNQHITTFGVLNTPHNDIRDLIEKLQMLQPEAIVIEDFILHSKRKSRSHADTCKVIGAVMGWATIYRLPMDFQTPSMRKAFVRFAKDLAPRNVSIHSIDALAHMLTWHQRTKNRISDVVDKAVYDNYGSMHIIDIAEWNRNVLRNL